MRKIQAFFTGILLLLIVFAMLVVVSFIYRAFDGSSIKTYIFQMNNSANQRVGVLQNINDISDNDLRNRLIKKYVSEYFKVIPGDNNVTNRPILLQMSSPAAFSQWDSMEAPKISEMSEKNMFRMAKVSDGGIEILNNEDNIDYNSAVKAEHVYYLVHYDTYTWAQSNVMETEPQHDQGVIYIEARFKPGIKPDITNVREYLESGGNPASLFMFEVTNIGSKSLQ